MCIKGLIAFRNMWRQHLMKHKTVYYNCKYFVNDVCCGELMNQVVEHMLMSLAGWVEIRVLRYNKKYKQTNEKTEYPWQYKLFQDVLI